MSDYRAVATVTAAIQQILTEAVPNTLPHAVVTTRRPDELAHGETKVGINVYLFQVSVNPSFRNQDLPLRSSDGRVVHGGYIPLDLHYLVTFYGQDDRHEPELLLALATVALARNTALTPERLALAVGGAPHAFLAGSDLAFQSEKVRLDLAVVSREEMHRIWTIFSPTPYRLSSVYQASVVLLDLEPPPGEPPSVATTRVSVAPSGPVSLDAVVPSRIAAEPGAVFRLRTKAPAGTPVLIDDVPVPTEPDPEAGWLSARLPDGCPAGTRTVRLAGEGMSSPSFPLVVLPTLQELGVHQSEDGLTLVARVWPPPASGQNVEILLNMVGTGATAASRPLRFLISTEATEGEEVSAPLRSAFEQNGHRLPPSARLVVVEDEKRIATSGARNAAQYALRPDSVGGGTVVYPGLHGSDGAGACAFRFPSLAPGRYRVRVRVDGAESPPDPPLVVLVRRR